MEWRRTRGARVDGIRLVSLRGAECIAIGNGAQAVRTLCHPAAEGHCTAGAVLPTATVREFEHMFEHKSRRNGVKTSIGIIREI